MMRTDGRGKGEMREEICSPNPRMEVGKIRCMSFQSSLLSWALVSEVSTGGPPALGASMRVVQGKFWELRFELNHEDEITKK